MLDGEVLQARPFASTFARLASHGDGSCLWHSLAASLNWRGYRDLAHTPSVRFLLALGGCAVCWVAHRPRGLRWIHSSTEATVT